MTYCNSKTKAIINFEFGDGERDTVISKNPPVEVIASTPESQQANCSNCWRFSGQGVYNDSFYEHFACGDNPRFLDNGQGLNLYFNDALLLGSGYQYRRGTGRISKVASADYTSGFFSSGTCSISKPDCSISISDSTGVIYQKNGKCPVNYNVSCDDDCPEGYCKCECTNYPGYCCYDNNGIPLRN